MIGLIPHPNSAEDSDTPHSGVSTTTANTRIWRRCNRTRITSEAIGALLDRWCINHRFQQGLDPYSGTLNHPPPHVYAQAQLSQSKCLS